MKNKNKDIELILNCPDDPCKTCTLITDSEKSDCRDDGGCPHKSYFNEYLSKLKDANLGSIYSIYKLATISHAEASDLFQKAQALEKDAEERASKLKKLGYGKLAKAIWS